jgi:hypothetical protein
MELYISDRVFWQCTIKAYRDRMKMRVGNGFENGRPFPATAGSCVNFHRVTVDIKSVHFKTIWATLNI